MDPSPVVIRPLSEQDLQSVAELHSRAFDGYFTTQLGPQFLHRLYREFVENANAMGYVAMRSGRLVGIVAGVVDATSFYAGFYRRNFGALAGILLRALITHRSVRWNLLNRLGHVGYAVRAQFQGLLGTKAYRTSSSIQARLVSICVSAESRGQGVAELLIRRFEGWLRENGVQSVGLSVRDNNARAIAFYEKTGWQRERQVGSGVYFFRSTTNEIAADYRGELVRIRAEYTRRAADPELTGRYLRLNLANLFAIQSRERALARLLRAEGLTSFANLKILDVGCGSGSELLLWLLYGVSPKNLVGIDFLHDRLRVARGRAPHLSFAQADGQHLPYANAVFDVVTQATVFSSILDATLRQRIAVEMMRVLKPDGLILWYDFIFNPTNPHTRGIGVREIRELFPGCTFRFHRVTLAPPLARVIAPRSWFGGHFLEAFPFLRTHYLVGIRTRRNLYGKVITCCTGLRL
jgi:ubiquinone/menaquinone biosynthesis C-methylase UbiE/ribosomal protein S18 acetylase RimI-like enzyme